MEWDGKDFREYERIDGELIPECFKFFFIERGFGNKIKAITTDITVKGIRFLIPPEAGIFSVGDCLIIYPLDKDYKLVGEIIHVISLSKEKIYFGVKLLKTKSLDEYIKVVEELF